MYFNWVFIQYFYWSIYVIVFLLVNVEKEGCVQKKKMVKKSKQTEDVEADSSEVDFNEEFAKDDVIEGEVEDSKLEDRLSSVEDSIKRIEEMMKTFTGKLFFLYSTIETFVSGTPAIDTFVSGTRKQIESIAAS